MIGLASEDAPADLAIGGGEEDLRRLEMEPEVLLRCDGGFHRWSSSCHGIVMSDVLTKGFNRGAITTRKLEGVIRTRDTGGLY